MPSCAAYGCTNRPGRDGKRSITFHKGADFRTDFNRLGELTCMFPDRPHLAVTATATSSAINSLCATLQFVDATKIVVSPNRPNIYIEKKEGLPDLKRFSKYDDILGQIVPELKMKKQEFPVTIVYMENLDSLGYAYKYTEDALGENAYIPKDKKEPENRIFGQYHKDYTEKMKKHIVSELRTQNPTLRLVFATVALGMGLNSPCVTKVVHFRPPTTLENYMQEIGRAGRSGQAAYALLFYNNNDLASNRKGLSEAVKPFCLTKLCLREHLLKHFGFDLPGCVNGRCCSNCDVNSQMSNLTATANSPKC